MLSNQLEKARQQIAQEKEDNSNRIAELESRYKMRIQIKERYVGTIEKELEKTRTELNNVYYN